jgi:LacI family transcriptional regulator
MHGPWLFFMGPEFYVRGIERSYRWMREFGADGVFAPLWDVRIIDMVVQLGLPAVICGMEMPTLQACRVVTDDDAVGQMAAKYFLERGFHQFAFCGFEDAIWSQKRGESFGRVVTEVGFEAHDYRTAKSSRRRSTKGKTALIAEWLAALPKPVAVMACNDDRGQDVLAACRIARLEVPGEVAILGVDNDNLVCDLSYPPLSSIAASTERAGYEAACVLDKLMKGQGITPREQEVVISPLYVVSRQSTDVMAIEDRQVAEAVRFIRNNCRMMIQVGDVADAVGLSRRTLEQRFRRALDHSIHEEIKYARVNLMADLLTSTNLPISQITRMLGYPYPNNISRTFKQQKGVSPMEYRKRSAPK